MTIPFAGGAGSMEQVAGAGSRLFDLRGFGEKAMQDVNQAVERWRLDNSRGGRAPETERRVRRMPLDRTDEMLRALRQAHERRRGQEELWVLSIDSVQL